MLDVVNYMVNHMPMNIPHPLNGAHHDGKGRGGLFREIFRTHQALIQVFSSAMGFPASRLALMRTLALAHPEGLGTIEAARRLGVTPAAVTRNLKELEADGLLERLPSGHDGRQRRVTLSGDGLALFGALHEKSHQIEAEVCEGVDDADLEACARVFGRIRQQLRRLSDGRSEP